MSDPTGADPAPVPQPRVDAVLALAGAAVEIVKDLAPYGVVVLVILRASAPTQLSAFGVHVLDLAIGAALIAIAPSRAKGAGQ